MQRGAPSGDCRAGQLSIPGASWHSPPTTGVTRLAGTVYHLETVGQQSIPGASCHSPPTTGVKRLYSEMGGRS